MKIKILAIEEGESLISDLSKFAKSEIKILNLISEKRKMVVNPNIETLNIDLVQQVKRINALKHNFDLCVVSSWNAAKLAYLSDLNYIIWFIGDDIRIPPFVKDSKPSYFTKPVNRKNICMRIFYKKVFENAIACVTGSQELFQYLKKFRDDAIRIDRMVIDPKTFNPDITPIKLQKSKFTFFCPQRIGVEKGIDVLWSAIELTKEDFHVLQIDWYDDKSPEANVSSNRLIQNLPKKIKLIPPVKKNEISKYYTFADAILGEFKTGHTNSIEREAALCKRAVLCFNDINQKSFFDGKEIETPFLPKSQNLEEIADIIDKIVRSKEFRDDLSRKEFEFMIELCNPEKAALEWDNLFFRLHKKYPSIDRKFSAFSKIIKNFFIFLCNQ